MVHSLIIAVLLFIVTLLFYSYEGFYNPYKSDQRPYEMEDHSYDGDLFQAETILYTMISKIPNHTETKHHLSELLNMIQYI